MKLGRPKADNPRRTWLNIRLTPSERKAIKLAASSAGLSVSAYVRSLGARAKQRLEKAAS